MQPAREECYFCGRTEDDEGVWLKPVEDEFICEECEEEQEAKANRHRPDPYDEWRELQWDKADNYDDFDY